MDKLPLPPTDFIAHCTADEWTTIPRPTTGADARAFDDAEKQLRAKHGDPDAKNWQTEFRIKGDVALTKDMNGLHFIPHGGTKLLSGNVPPWKAKVVLMDASSTKAEAGFTWDRNEGKATLNKDVA